MKTYIVEIDGKQYDIQGDRPPTEQEARSAIQSFSSQPQVSPEEVRKQQTQLEQNARPENILSSALAQTGKDILGGVGTAVNTAGFGLPQMAAQAMGTSILPEDNGQMGQKVANVAGTIAGAAVPIGGVIQAGKSAVNIIPKLLKWETELQQAKKAQTAINDIRTTLGQAKEIAIAPVVSQPTALDMRLLLSDRVKNTIKNPVYGIQFAKNGDPIQTVGNLDRVKDAVGEFVGSPAMWAEAPKEEIAHAKWFYGQVNEAMKVAAKKAGHDIQPALSAYNDFMKKYHLIADNIQNKAGVALGNKLKTAFKFGSEEANQVAWKEVAKVSPEIKKVVSSMNHREILRQALKLSPYAGGVAAGAVGVKALNR